MRESARVLIVDDEPLARQRLVRMLGESDRALVVETASSGVEAVERIRAFAPDVVFLDVEMPGLSGFDVLRQIESRAFHVVFQTAFDSYAVRAFEAQACDYLVKPFSKERLLASLDRALDRVADASRLRRLERELAANGHHLERLAVRQGARLRVVDVDDVATFISRDHATCAYFDDGREAIVDLSIERLASRLDPTRFARLHRGSIVRTTAIAALATGRDGALWIETRFGMRLPVSRSRRRVARELVQSLGRA